MRRRREGEEYPTVLATVASVQTHVLSNLSLNAVKPLTRLQTLAIHWLMCPLLPPLNTKGIYSKF
jgi:hypothetical protein